MLEIFGGALVDELVGIGREKLIKVFEEEPLRKAWSAACKNVVESYTADAIARGGSDSFQPTALDRRMSNYAERISLPLPEEILRVLLEGWRERKHALSKDEASPFFAANENEITAVLTTVANRFFIEVAQIPKYRDPVLVLNAIPESPSSREEDRRILLRILAEVSAGQAAGIEPSQSVQERHTIKEAITSRNPERRRAAYLACGNTYMARATHELEKELRLISPALDHFQQAADEFADTLFEGDLLNAEGKVEEAIQYYEKAHELKPSDGFGTVALANALMDRAMTPRSDGSDWKPGKDQWVASVDRVENILLPFLEAGNTPSNPAYLPALWAHAHLWYHSAEARIPNAVETSTNSLLRADLASPNHPVTLRLLGRNFYRFTREPDCAEPYFRRAIDADPGDIRQKFYYGLYLTDRPNRDADAAASFEQCLDINPDDPHVLEAFAFLLSKRPSNVARAELMWKHALRVSPNHALGWERYGRFLTSLPDGMARAEDIYRKGLANRANDAKLWAAYAILLERQPGRESDAIAAYDKALALAPASVEAKVRAVMHKIVAGTFANPEQVGMWILNEGITSNNPQLLVAGAWLGVLYATSEEQLRALTLLKSLCEHFGESMGFIRQPRSTAQSVAAGNQFGAWLDPLSKVISGELPLSSLDVWEAWTTA
ncbi:MAG TPA: hypothetical protein VKV95_17490 [Terriglobia bacterium]|nr:hypothetical protein [Terriglobia bacterium]